jgi:hypothetical protein
VFTSLSQISWLAGTGNDVGPEQVIVANNTRSNGIALADYNMDGKIDLAYTAYQANEVKWLSNNGSGVFTPEGDIMTGTNFPGVIKSADINNNGFPGVVIVSTGNDHIYLVTNNGTNVFNDSEPITVTNSKENPVDVLLFNVDNDDDIDIVSAALEDSSIIWNETSILLGIEDNILKEGVILYPNPASNDLNINSPEFPMILEIKLYNILGQLILESPINQKSIDISQIPSGSYLIHIYFDETIVVKHFIKN